MRIALVCPYDLGRYGGVQDQVTKLAEWLGDAGHETVVVGPGETGPPGAVLVGPVTVVPANGAMTPVTLDARAGRRVLDAVAGADVVHVHEPLMPVVSLAALRSAATPLVATFHASPPATVRFLYRVARPPIRALLQRARAVTAVSPVASAAIEGVVPVRIVPNGVDVDLIAAAADAGRRPSSVAFVGRADRRKGLAVLLEAWPEVRRHHPEATLDVIGAESADQVPGVTFLGPLDEEEKRARLAVASVLAAPNLSGESFGVVLAEAMAAGCAVVTSALPGFVHVVGDAARLVPPGDPAALADALVLLIGDPAGIADLAGRGLARVRRFDRAVVVDGYLEAYHDALQV